MCTVDGCDHQQGFTSKGDLSRHMRIVHKLESGQGTLFFCSEPNCPRGPSGGPDAGFSRKDNLADHMRRKHGQSSTASSCIPRRAEIANETTLPDVGLESPRHMDEEPVASPQNKRRRISEMGLSSQDMDQGDGEVMYLRSELTKMKQREEELTKELAKRKQREEELTKELKEAQRKYEGKSDQLMGIIERLAPLK